MSEEEMAQTFKEIMNMFLKIELVHLFRPKTKLN
jgi:hypothetical protein